MSGGEPIIKEDPDVSRTRLAAWLGVAVAALAVIGQAGSVPMKQGLISVKVRVGLKDTKPSPWEGSYRVTEGRIIATDGWRFAGDDYATLEKFKCQVRRNFPIFWNRRVKSADQLPVWPNGFVLTLDGVTPGSQLELKTSRGECTVPLGNLGLGSARMFLDGNVEVERVPTSRHVVQSPLEEYAPSAAAMPGGGLAIAYIAFTHGKGFEGGRPMKEEPKDYSFLAAPPGGDQLMFVELKDGQWTEPEPLTEKGQDLFRTATAVDGKGNVWVFWSANADGNWDVYARVRTGGQWGAPMRVTTEAGSDVNVVAATDSEGRVWTAWQGCRGSSFDVFAARQQGTKLGAAEQVGGGPANEWTPAVAASADGQVAVAWDTYERGDYDVRVRLWQGGAWKAPRVVAATAANECRASIAFDKQNRLWIAHEICPEGWGKDFGPYDEFKKPTCLYRHRAVGVAVLAGDQLMTPAGNVNHALPMPQGTRRWPKANRNAVLACGPRIAVDAQGRVWLSARIKVLKAQSGAGTSWTSFLTTCEGDRWRAATVVPNNSGLLHETPALVAAPGSGLRVVSTDDGRIRRSAFFGNLGWRVRRRSKTAPPANTRNFPTYPDQWVNWEIAVADTGRIAPPTAIKLAPLPVAVPAGPIPPEVMAARIEARHVKAIRGYRADIGGKSLRILRGEFHRHTEISGDGGGDGTAFDMWRYGIDMASMDWIGFGDHDNGGGREFTWWLSQKTTDIFHIRDHFTSMFTYERSVSYPDGHRNVVFAQRGVRTLPRLRGGIGKAMDDKPDDFKRPHSPDVVMLYKYLKHFGGVCAVHTSGTDMGTDWRDNDPEVEPIVEIYQGDRQNYERPGAPRTNTADYSLGGWRPLGFVSRALMMGYRLGFQSSSDHISTHMSYCNVWVEKPTRAEIIKAMKLRRIYGATDNIIADVRCEGHFMGEEFTLTKPPTLRVKLIGTAPFAKVVIVKDNQYVHTLQPNQQTVEFTWTDRDATPGKTSYYYVRGIQVGKDIKRTVRSLATKQRTELSLNDGEVVWVSPMWITYRP